MQNFARNRMATFFSILNPFWPTFGHFTSSWRYSLCRGARPIRLSKNLKFDWKSPKVIKIELTIKMCGISSEIAWQLFFSILESFWPNFGHFTSSGRYSLYRGAGPKRLSQNLKFDRNITKNGKNRTYHQNVRNFVRNRVATFFFDETASFWRIFDFLRF